MKHSARSDRQARADVTHYVSLLVCIIPYVHQFCEYDSMIVGESTYAQDLNIVCTYSTSQSIMNRKQVCTLHSPEQKRENR